VGVGSKTKPTRARYAVKSVVYRLDMAAVVAERERRNRHA
jgi:hypothetical protein